MLTRVARLAVLVGALAFTGVAGATSLLPPPPSFLPSPNPCVTASARPHVVSIGDAVKGQVGPGTPGDGTCNITKPSWRWYFRGAPVTGCGLNAGTCRLHSQEPTNSWQSLCIVGASRQSGGLTACDYVWILPKGLFDLSGTVSAHTASDASGVSVHVTGPGGGQTTTTDASGNYAFAVKPGSYAVTVKPRPGAAATVRPSSRSVAVHRDTTGIDFELAPNVDQLTLRLSPGSLVADGSGHFTGSAEDLDSTGAPVSGKSLMFTPPTDVTPRALVCSAHGLLYPTLLSDGSPLGSHFAQTSDGGGLVELSVWPGTVAGSWLLEAVETGDGSVHTSTSLPFGAGAGASFSPGLVPRQFRDAVGKTIGGPGAISLFTKFGAVGQSQASNQAVLLAFLDTVTGSFRGADFGPVHAGDVSGIVFYPHGRTDPAATGFVLGIDQASDIVDALASGKPIPAADESMPALSVWASQHGGDTAAGALGSLSPPPGERFEYFGFPYPPPVTDPVAQTAFYGPCVPPDPAVQIVQTHSPVAVSFSGAGGYRFGLDGSGKRVGDGTGLVLRHAGSDVTTYVVPSGAYRLTVAATGTGPATIVSLAPGSRAQTVRSYTLRVRHGQSGSLTLAADGATGSLRVGTASARAGHGFPLTVRGLPKRLRARHRARIAIRVTTLGAPVAGALVMASGAGRVAAVTNATGRATLLIVPGARGRVKVAVTAPGGAAVRRTVAVRR